MHIPLFFFNNFLFKKETSFIKTDVMAISTLKKRSVYGSQLQRPEMEKLIRKWNTKENGRVCISTGRNSKTEGKRMACTGNRGHSFCQSLWEMCCFHQALKRTAQMTCQLTTLHSWPGWQKGCRLPHMLFLFPSAQNSTHSAWFTPLLRAWEKYRAISYVDSDFLLFWTSHIHKDLVCICTIYICKHIRLCMPQSG